MSAPEKDEMPRTRSRAVLILLVLMLILASVLFGLLTYWPDEPVRIVTGGRRKPRPSGCLVSSMARPLLARLEHWARARKEVGPENGLPSPVSLPNYTS